MNILFEGPVNFPISNCIEDLFFTKETQGEFTKKCYVKGIQVVNITDKSKNIPYDVIVKEIEMLPTLEDTMNAELLNYEEIPHLYCDASLGKFRYIITKKCENCGPVATDILNEEEIFPIKFDFCSEKCRGIISNENDLISIDKNSIPETGHIKHISKQIGPKLYSFMHSTTSRDEKFQSSMKREALRLQFSEHREKYKKNMKQLSSKKSNNSASTTSLRKKDNDTRKICEAKTKKGVRCTNKVVAGKNYCGILSHQLTDAKQKMYKNVSLNSLASEMEL